MLFSTIEAGTEIQTQPTESGGGGGGGNIRLEMRGVKEKKKKDLPSPHLPAPLPEGGNQGHSPGRSCHVVSLWGDRKKKTKNIVDLYFFSLNLVKTLNHLSRRFQTGIA